MESETSGPVAAVQMNDRLGQSASGTGKMENAQERTKRRLGVDVRTVSSHDGGKDQNRAKDYDPDEFVSHAVECFMYPCCRTYFFLFRPMYSRPRTICRDLSRPASADPGAPVRKCSSRNEGGMSKCMIGQSVSCTDGSKSGRSSELRSDLSGVRAEQF